METPLEKTSLNVVSTQDYAESTDSGNSGFLLRFARKLKAETKGVDIVTDEEKTETSVLPPAFVWLSTNMAISTYSLGVIGVTAFGLDFWSSTLTIIFFTLLGTLPVAFFSSFGVRMGLRQMVAGRFLMGNIGVRISSFLNMVACVGWGSVNIMSSAQLLTVVNNGALPPWAGCLVLLICTVVVSFFGYRVIHIYDTWCWVPNMVVFLTIAIRIPKTHAFTVGTMIGGATTAGNVLSFGGAIFGFAAGWATNASDYTVYQKRDANLIKVFFSVLVGLWFPLLSVMVLGSASAMITVGSDKYAEMYKANSVGGIVYGILVQDSLHGFGQFLCVVLAMSTVANNLPNMYSASLSAQAFYSKAANIPRFVWTTVGCGASLGISIAGYYHFVDVLNDFMNLVAYSCAIFCAIVASEHYIHNRGSFAGYDLENYKNKSVYPMGWASLFGYACGAAGVVVGMDQVWYQGVLGRRIGEDGGDIGFELAFAFCMIGFNFARYFEKKYIGR